MQMGCTENAFEDSSMLILTNPRAVRSMAPFPIDGFSLPEPDFWPVRRGFTCPITAFIRG